MALVPPTVQVPFSAVALARTPSKKTNVLILEENRAIALTPARVRCEDSAQRKTTKMASEITVVGDEKIQFLSSVSLPNLRQALEENFLDSDSGYEDCTSDSDDGSENILEKSCSEDASDMSDEAFPLDGRNVLREKRRRNTKISVEGESSKKRENISRIYISSEDVQRLKSSRKDCKIIFQARCEEKYRTDKSLSLFPLQEK